MGKRARDVRPLRDPHRAPYVRAVLDRKERKRAREALDALVADPERRASAMAHVAAIMAIVAEPES